MEMDVVADIRAPDDATLDLYCDRVASAVGRLSVRVFGMEEQDGIALAHHLGRALQLTNILRDLDEDAAIGRLYLPREALREAGIAPTDPATVLASPALGEGLRARRRARARPFRAKPTRSWRAARAGAVRAPRIMGEAYRLILDRLVARGWSRAAASDPSAARAAAVDHHASRLHLMPRTVHVIGAGLAGLAAAVRLATHGTSVVVHEAAGQAGGRCRSYHDPALDMAIDNGNHLLLSGNHAALSYLADDRRRRNGWSVRQAAEFAFVDLANGERWTLRINDGRLPWWIFDARPPRAGHDGARLSVASRRLLLAVRDKDRSARSMSCAGRSTSGWRGRSGSRRSTSSRRGERGASPAPSSARRWSPAGKACRPLIARDGLGARLHRAGAARSLRERNAQVAVRPPAARAATSRRTRSRRSISARTRSRSADGDRRDPRGAAGRGGGSVPGLTTPTEFRAIVNAHFRIDPPAGLAADHRHRQRHHRMAVRLSRTACRSPSAPPTACSTRRARRWRRTIWEEVAAVAGLPSDAAAVADRARAPRDLRRDAGAECQAAGRRETAWSNLLLAGDWTETGLPATIEGAIRSGNRAADLVGAM